MRIAVLAAAGLLLAACAGQSLIYHNTISPAYRPYDYGYNFTTTPGPSARPQYRAVLLFNRATALPNRICRGPDRVPVAELGETMRLIAVFCRHGGFLSQVTGEIKGVTGIDDPRFRGLIRQMVPLLFPPVDPTRDDDDVPFFITGDGLRWSWG
jgi:hypothetical protein